MSPNAARLTPIRLGVAAIWMMLPAFLPAAGNAPNAVSAEQQSLCEQFVEERLAVWQGRLKLRDWRISVRMVPRNALKRDTLGGIRWDKKAKTAVISMLEPAGYNLPFHRLLEDMEFTIVHELVHLELASLPRSEASRRSEERAVNSIAEALLELDRQK